MRGRKYIKKAKPVLKRAVLRLMAFCMLTGCLTGYVAQAEDVEIAEAAATTCPKAGMEYSASAPKMYFGTAINSYDSTLESQSLSFVFTEGSPLFELFGGSYPTPYTTYDITGYLNDEAWMSKNGQSGRIGVTSIAGQTTPVKSPLSCSLCGTSITYTNRQGQTCPATVYIFPDGTGKDVYHFQLKRTSTEPYKWTIMPVATQPLDGVIGMQEGDKRAEVDAYNQVLWEQWQKELEYFNNSPKPPGFVGSGPPEPVEKYRSYPEYHIYTESAIANLTHTYTVDHKCGDSCKERLHTHKLKYEQEAWEEECPGTLTILSTSSTEVSETCECGRTWRYTTEEAKCACGEKIQIRHYKKVYNMCSCSYEDRYFDSEGTKHTSWGAHTLIKGVHEETCTYTSTYIKGDLRDVYYVGCPYCGTIFSKNTYLYSKKVNTRDGTVAEDYYDSEIYATAGSYHTFTWKDTAEDSCYYQGPIVQAKDTYTKVESADGDNYVDAYCRTCDYHGTWPLCHYTAWSGAGAYQFFYSGLMYGTYALGEAMPARYITFCSLNDDFNWLDAEVGDTFIRYKYSHLNDYDYRGNRTNNLVNAYHRSYTGPVCGLLEYGEKVCDKVVTKIMPVETKQVLGVGDELNRNAYVGYLNGTYDGLVTCDVQNFNPTKYNVWQTVTLSYGQYSSVSSKTPKKVTIQVYVERTNADLTLEVSPVGAGTLSGAGEHQVGSTVKASTVANPGYTFDGWYNEAGTRVSTKADYSFTMPGENITLTAKYTPKTYKVNAVSEYTAMGNVTAPTSAPYKSSVTVKATPVGGYVFEGWYDGVEKVSSNATYTFTMPCHDVELKARFTPPYITVSFNSNGGSSCASIKVQHLGIYGTLPIPTKDGYLFVGWKYGGEYINPLTPVTTKSNHTLTADWVEAGPEFIFVDFDNVYGRNSWSLDKANIGKFGLTTANFGMKLPEPQSTPIPFKLGYSFKGWFRSENAQNNGTGELVVESTPMTSAKEHILYAKWEPVTNKLYFDSNGGTSCSSINITYDRRYGYHNNGKLPEPTRSGYTFAGWYLTESGNNGYGIQIKDDTRVQTIKDQTVYARWTKEAINIKVTFSPYTKEQIGLSASESDALGYGSTIGEPLTGTTTFNLTYPGTYGYYPITWCRCEDDDTHVAANGWGFFGNQHYYINLNGSPVYAAFPKPVRVGYTFDNYWETSGGVKIDSLKDAVVISQKHTLYAHYTPKTYTITYDLYGNVSSSASASAPQIVSKPTTGTFDTAFTVSNPTRQGYVFNGWKITGMDSVVAHIYGSNTTTNTSISSTKETSYKNLRSSAGTVKFSANWTPVTYKMKYDLKGNKPNASTNPVITPTPPATATFDKAFTVKNPARAGYTFLGWNITGMGSCTHTYGSSTTTAASLTKIKANSFKNLHHEAGKTVTFTAQWQVNAYPVKLDGRGATSTNHTKNVTMTFDAACPSITVPTKTGYTFMGYYTDVRGGGTKYYDASGKSVKAWTETNVDTLYAYWKQNPVVLPDEDDYIVSDVEEEVVIEGNVGRTDGKGLLYADDYNASTGALTDLQPYLTYDTNGSTGVIPGTEKLAFRAKMASWMLNYKFYKNAGLDYVKIIVTVPYVTQYENSVTEELVISDVQTKDYTFSVPKAWSYWEVLESGMYYPDSVTISNEMLAEDGTLTVSVDRTGAGAVNAPDYSAISHGDKKNHVKWPEYDGSGNPVLTIELSEEQYIISDRADTPPNVDAHNRIVAKNAAWQDASEPEVRSDCYEFNGEVVLSDEWYYTSGAMLNQSKLPANADMVELTSYEQTYASGIEMKELKPNGRYETTAEITYVGDASNIGAETTKTVELADINDLNIHTPVACDGAITDGVEHTKDENGDELAVLTLKDALNFFTLRIDNTGTHLMSLGYGYKDFATAFSGKSNIAADNGSVLNQVQFPFDVYVDVGNDSRKADGSYDTENDCLLVAGKWITTGVELQNYYIPVTAENGKFTINFRSIAANCPPDGIGQDMAAYEEKAANLNQQNYIATDSLEMEIESYIKDFRIVSVEDPNAEEQLENGAGIVTMKKGYGFTYQLRTQGEFFGENVEIQTIPRYYWEPESGGSRKEVHLYRMDSLLSGESKECYAWDTEPLLLLQKNYDVILQRFSGRGMVSVDVLCVPVDEQEIFEEYVKKQTITGNEAFVMQNGCIYISFDIRVKSNRGKWYFLETGDVIGYDLSQSIEDDYEVGGME